jgi:hypothetical protein
MQAAPAVAVKASLSKIKHIFFGKTFLFEGLFFILEFAGIKTNQR